MQDFAIILHSGSGHCGHICPKAGPVVFSSCKRLHIGRHSSIQLLKLGQLSCVAMSDVKALTTQLKSGVELSDVKD